MTVITIETGMAQGILWPDRFEAQRRAVLSASMVSMRGRLQKEGNVIHVIIGRVTDLTPMLAQVGMMAFPCRTGAGDGASHGGSADHSYPGWQPTPKEGYHPPFDEALIWRIWCALKREISGEQHCFSQKVHRAPCPW